MLWFYTRFLPITTQRAISIAFGHHRISHRQNHNLTALFCPTSPINIDDNNIIVYAFWTYRGRAPFIGFVFGLSAKTHTNALFIVGPIAYCRLKDIFEYIVAHFPNDVTPASKKKTTLNGHRYVAVKRVKHYLSGESDLIDIVCFWLCLRNCIVILVGLVFVLSIFVLLLRKHNQLMGN